MHTRALACAIIAIGLALTGTMLSAASASAAPQTAIQNAITDISPVTTTPIATGDLLTLDGTWAVPDESAAGDTFDLQLPKELGWFGPLDFSLKDSAGDIVATGHADASGTVVFTLGDYVTDHPVDLHGTFRFVTRYTATQTDQGAQTLEFTVGGTVIGVPVVDAGPPTSTTEPSTPPSTISDPFKWAWWTDTSTQNRTHSLLSSPTLTAPAATLTITDTPAEGLALDCASLTVAVGTVLDAGWRVNDDLSAAHRPTVTCSTERASVTWHDLPVGATAQVNVDADVTDSSRTSFTNNGSILIDGVPTTVSNTVTYEGASGNGSGTPGAIVSPPKSHGQSKPGHSTPAGATDTTDSRLAFTGADSSVPLIVAVLLMVLGVIFVAVPMLSRWAARRI